MYRDSQHGLTIDLSGPDGNVFFLIGYGMDVAKQLGKDPDKFKAQMTAGDYDNAVSVFEKWFKYTIRLINKP